MRLARLPRFRFCLKSLLVLMLGISIGYALNLQTFRFLIGPANEARMTSLPTYRIEPPDVLRVDISSQRAQTSGNGAESSAATSGEHLVGPDGKINLGRYGQVYVAGMTLGQARRAIEQAVRPQIESPQVVVDVLNYNSKVYYIISRQPGTGDQVQHVPITGHDTVLDAIAQIGGLKSPDSTQIWIARPSASGRGSQVILPIDWEGIAGGASAATNYQLLPSDRLFVVQTASPDVAN